MLPHPLPLFLVLFAASFAFAQNWASNPFVPPAIPLAVKTPYLQTWVPQGTTGGALYSGWEAFRDNTTIAWLGIVRVDGESFVWMGDPSEGTNPAVQKEVSFTSTKTIVTTSCGGVDIIATFLSPIEPTDLVNQSIPFSYLAVEFIANDGNPHKVQHYTDISKNWLTEGDQPEWQTNVAGGIVTHQFYLPNQTEFLEVDGRLRYGNVMYSTKQITGMTYQVGNYDVVRSLFRATGILNNSVDLQFDASDDQSPVFAFDHDLGIVGTIKTAPIVYTVGYVRDPLVQLLNVPNTTTLLGAYYLTRYSSIPDMITELLDDYLNALARSTDFDNSLTNAALAVTPQNSDYADILALSVRQMFGNIELTCGWNGTAHVPAGSRAFMRDGFTNTVDIIYSAWPALLYTNPIIGNYLLEPILAYQAANPVQDGYAIHDIGDWWYPNVTGPSTETYPVEETGNQLIMALSYTQKTSDNSLITKYQFLYDQFATYLVNNGLYTSSQLSADSFAGPLANQTNLAVKSIIALKAASEIFQILGNSTKSQYYNSVATSLLEQWQDVALSSDKSHYTLAYGNNTSWSLLYNLYADKLLGFNMFPQSVYEIQTKWYASKLDNFGIQLDSRSTDARTDWQLWTAATVTNETLRTTMINLVRKYASSGINGAPFPDRYNSENGQMVAFYDRTVVGGHFALLLVPDAAQGGTNSTGTNGNKNGRNGGEPIARCPAFHTTLTLLITLIYALL